jgi:hypothetical protein
VSTREELAQLTTGAPLLPVGITANAPPNVHLVSMDLISGRVFMLAFWISGGFFFITFHFHLVYTRLVALQYSR